MKDQGIIFCTYFDKNYLPRGLALYSSLIKCSPSMKLWILCLDNYTKDTLDTLKLKGVTTIFLKEFEDKELLAAKKNRSLVEYYWTCTPSLILYVLKHSRDSKVVYLDADMYFFSSPASVFNELGNKSIYIVEHRFPKGQEIREKSLGRFNVAFMIFFPQQESLKCLRHWRKQCLDWCYWKKEDGKLGDQMYLDEWPTLYKGLVISQNLGIDVAPWNVLQYKIIEKNRLVFIENDRLICYHFHQFQILGDDKFKYALGYRFPNVVKQYIYQPYIEEIIKSIKIIKKVDSNFKIIPQRRSYPQLVKNILISYLTPFYWKTRSILRS